MAVTNYYVDPVNGDNVGGDGLSDATAWKTTQFAIDSITQVAGTPIAINRKDNGTETLTASLDWSSLVLNRDNVVYLRGYTATAGDGGIATYDCNGFKMTLAQMHYMYLEDFELTNPSGADTTLVIWGGNYTTINRVIVNDFNVGFNNALIFSTSFGLTVQNCSFSDISGTAIQVRSSGGCIYSNYFQNTGTRDIRFCINWINASSPLFIESNIAYLTGSTDFTASGNVVGARVRNNTLITTGTGDAISSGDTEGWWAQNNIIQGFNNAIDIGNRFGNRNGHFVNKNFYFDNTTNETADTQQTMTTFEGNIDSLSSGIAESGSPSFANRFNYFKPVGDAVGGVSDGLSIGAVQFLLLFSLISGSASSTATAIADVTFLGSISGSALSSTSTSASLTATGELEGSVSSASNTSASLIALGDLAGSTSSAANVTVSISAIGETGGAVASTAQANCTLSGIGELTGNATSQTTVIASMADSGKGEISGSASSSSLVTANLIGLAQLSGALTAETSSDAVLTGIGSIEGAALNTANTQGNLTGIGNLSGSATLVASASLSIFDINSLPDVPGLEYTLLGDRFHYELQGQVFHDEIDGSPMDYSIDGDKLHYQLEGK